MCKRFTTVKKLQEMFYTAVYVDSKSIEKQNIQSLLSVYVTELPLCQHVSVLITHSPDTAAHNQFFNGSVHLLI